MLYPISIWEEPPELTTDELAAIAETVARVKEAVAEIARREHARPQGLIERGSLTREGMDAATGSLGMPPVSDEEWSELRGGRTPDTGV